MADDTSKTGSEDRRTVAGGEPDDVAYIAKGYGLKREQVHGLIEKPGHARVVPEAEAQNLAT